MFRNLLDGPHVIVLLLVIVLVFGWKKLPDVARSLGRSMRIFKTEVEEMKKDGKPTPSAASSDTVKGETVEPPPSAKADQPWSPAERETHNQPPA